MAVPAVVCVNESLQKNLICQWLKTIQKLVLKILEKGYEIQTPRLGFSDRDIGVRCGDTLCGLWDGASAEKICQVELPKVKNYQPTDAESRHLQNISKWVNVKCPKCKGKAKEETDTMPNWAGSSWYFLRYTDPKNNKEFASKKNLNYWMEAERTTAKAG